MPNTEVSLKVGGLKLQSVGKKVEIKVEAEEFVLVWRGQGTVVVEAEKAGRLCRTRRRGQISVSAFLFLVKKIEKRRQ